jgi:hypothetical protein
MGKKITVRFRNQIAQVPEIPPQGVDRNDLKAGSFQKIAKAKTRESEIVMGNLMLLTALRRDQE